MKTGVAAALARYRGEARYAVVFDVHDWWPWQPPAGEEWDYRPEATLERALETAREMAPEADAEVWQRGEHGWEQSARR